MPAQGQNDAIPHVKGDSLSLAARVKLPPGDWTGESALRYPDTGALVAELVVGPIVELDPTPDADGYTHAYVVTHEPADQEDWPVQLVDCAVRYVRTGDGFTKTTPPFKVRVLRDQA